MRLLARAGRGRLVLLTGAVMRPLAHDLLGLRYLLPQSVYITAAKILRLPCMQVHVPMAFHDACISVDDRRPALQGALHASLANTRTYACHLLYAAALLILYWQKKITLGRRPVAFRPAHEQKLANEFELYTNAEDIAEGLGGWDGYAGNELASFGSTDHSRSSQQDTGSRQGHSIGLYAEPGTCGAGGEGLHA